MAEMALASALLYYVYLALGSVSVGYLLVRFAYPEVRVFTHEEKLGASALVGLLIVLMSVLADFAVFGLDAVLSAKGQTLWFWTAGTIAAFGILKVTLKEKNSEVAIPVTKKLQSIQHELDKMEEKPPETQTEISKKLNELRKKGLIPRSDVGEELIKSITPEKPKPKEKPKEKVPDVLKDTPIEVTQNVREAKKVLEKAKEAEIDAIFRDLNLKFGKVVGGYKRHARPASVVTQGLDKDDSKKEEIRKPSESTTERPRRLYMLKQGQTTSAQTKEKPAKKEEKEKQAQAEPQEKESGPVTMEDLFGPAEPSAKPAQNTGNVSLIPSVQAPKTCPHCGSKNSRIVFCPYCGTGMCANCSPSISPTADGFTYQCPKCGEEVPVKRRAATLG